MRSEPWSSNYGQLKTAAYECWEPNSGSLEEQNLFLAMELSPAPGMIFTFFFFAFQSLSTSLWFCFPPLRSTARF